MEINENNKNRVRRKVATLAGSQNEVVWWLWLTLDEYYEAASYCSPPGMGRDRF